MARPRPLPPCARSGLVGAVEAVEDLVRLLRRRPGPWSMTSSTAVGPLTTHGTSTGVPGGVCSRALASRLTRPGAAGRRRRDDRAARRRRSAPRGRVDRARASSTASAASSDQVDGLRSSGRPSSRRASSQQVLDEQAHPGGLAPRCGRSAATSAAVGRRPGGTARRSRGWRSAGCAARARRRRRSGAAALGLGARGERVVDAVQHRVERVPRRPISVRGRGLLDAPPGRGSPAGDGLRRSAPCAAAAAGPARSATSVQQRPTPTTARPASTTSIAMSRRTWRRPRRARWPTANARPAAGLRPDQHPVAAATRSPGAMNSSRPGGRRGRRGAAAGASGSRPSRKRRSRCRPGAHCHA